MPDDTRFLAPPQLTVAPLVLFDPTDPKQILKAFADLPDVAMQQTFLPLPEPDFLAATVRAGWNQAGLWVLANLPDPDIFSDATEDNQPLWTLGDVFEVFLRPDGQDAYFEFHVAPTGHRLSLRFPSAQTIIEMRRNPQESGITPYMLATDAGLLQAWAWQDKKVVGQTVGTWNALACVSASIDEAGRGLAAGAVWHFSFSRYDYQKDRDEPLVSSTSPHQEANFHDQSAWGTLTFTGTLQDAPPAPKTNRVAKKSPVTEGAAL